jgi:hypothetical protein
MRKELYFSTDIEADGPLPYQFAVNVTPLADAKQDPDTMAFWAHNPEAYAATKIDQVDPWSAMRRYVAWVDATCKGHHSKIEYRPVFVAFPAGFDFLFMYWYMVKFAGRSPFSFSALDLKSYAMAKLGCQYRASAKRNFPAEWFPKDLPHTHVAIDDAIEQGHLFLNMLKHKP